MFFFFSPPAVIKPLTCLASGCLVPFADKIRHTVSFPNCRGAQTLAANRGKQPALVAGPDTLRRDLTGFQRITFLRSSVGLPNEGPVERSEPKKHGSVDDEDEVASIVVE